MLNVLVVEGDQQREDLLLALLGILSDRSLFKQINIETVENVRALKNKLQQLEMPCIVILFANTAPKTIGKLAANYPEIRFFIFTNHIPRGKEIWIKRDWLGPDLLQSIINC